MLLLHKAELVREKSALDFDIGFAMTISVFMATHARHSCDDPYKLPWTLAALTTTRGTSQGCVVWTLWWVGVVNRCAQTAAREALPQSSEQSTRCVGAKISVDPWICFKNI